MTLEQLKDKEIELQKKNELLLKGLIAQSKMILEQLKSQEIKVTSDVEGLFRKISGLKQYGHFSLDIYYNDLDNTFVAKLSRIIFDKSYSDIHFRNVELFDSMLDAYNYLISISVKPK